MGSLCVRFALRCKYKIEIKFIVHFLDQLSLDQHHFEIQPQQQQQQPMLQHPKTINEEWHQVKRNRSKTVNVLGLDFHFRHFQKVLKSIQQVIQIFCFIDILDVVH